MGLDTYIFRKKLKPELEQVFDKLINADEGMEQIAYWRKNYNLVDWFNNKIGESENGKYYEITEEDFVDWLDDLESGKLKYVWDTLIRSDEIKKDIKMITKLLKETNFKTTKFFYYSWW